MSLNINFKFYLYQLIIPILPTTLLQYVIYLPHYFKKNRVAFVVSKLINIQINKYPLK